MENSGMIYLKKKLKTKKLMVDRRYRYYGGKNFFAPVYNANEPSEFKGLAHNLGWCTKAVNAVADRINFRGFENDRFDMNEIFIQNNQDVLVDNLIVGALVSACDFVYISKDEDGFPKLKVIDGANATGTLDPTTNLLIEGYAILEVDENKKPVLEAYFTKDKTSFYEKGKFIKEIDNPAPYPLLVPIIHRPDATHPFGRSRITKPCMEIQKAAQRTLHRAEISSEFYSYPQKYVLGTDPEAEPMEKFKASMSMMLEISKDGEGDKPTIGQFAQQSMSPYIDQIKMYAGLFAGETGLTLDDLGFITENPAGSESIKAAHETLRLATRKAQKGIAIGLLNVGYLAACVRDDVKYERHEIYNTKVKFEPIFEPDMSALSLIGDGAIKLNQAIPGYLNHENLRDLTGIESNPTNDFIYNIEPTEPNEDEE